MSVMRNPVRSAPACLLVAAICLLGAIGCGGGSDSETVNQRTSQSGAPEAGGTKQPLSPGEQRGRELFVQHCGSCHTFDAAGTVGQIGPQLDDIAINEADILHAIETGGGRLSHGAGGKTGNMPRNLVTGKDAQQVAAFVAANASGSSTP
jgi:mono/diheme cytochrome c family protein